MTTRRSILAMAVAGATALGLLSGTAPAAWAQTKDIVYLTPGLDLPFWRYLSKGVESVAKENGYGFQALDSHNSAETQLQNAQDAIARGVAGIVHLAHRQLHRAERAAARREAQGSRW